MPSRNTRQDMRD